MLLQHLVVALLSMFQLVIAQPTATDQSSFIVEHYANDLFPHSKGNLSAWDVTVEFIGYNSSMQSWLTSINPAAGESDEYKAEMLLEVAYAKPFDQTDVDMVSDRESILAIVAGNTTTSLLKRQHETTFRVATAHAVALDHLLYRLGVSAPTASMLAKLPAVSASRRVDRTAASVGPLTMSEPCSSSELGPTATRM